MTGLELLKQELKAKGFNDSQIKNSKILAAALDILANNGEENYLKEQELRVTIHTLLQTKSQISSEIALGRSEVYRLDRLKNTILSQLDEQCKEKQEYLEGLLVKINSCADHTTRNTIAKAQAFLQMVDVNTKYDNTAFIIGLASILSNGGVDAIGEMKKINPKITPVSEEFGYHFWEDRGYMKVKKV